MNQLQEDIDVKIEASWKEVLQEEFSKSYFRKIVDFLRQEKRRNKKTYPPGPLIFNAFNSCPFPEVKVVIIGQDPYHGPGQAMGLSFSVPENVQAPPSLKNIFQEIHNDLGIQCSGSGDLTPWAQQGVFLLNTTLTVEHRKAGSHKSIGWQKFTDAVIRHLSAEKEHLVFLLWGRFAETKAPLIDQEKHLILTSAHPSPLAGNRFFNNNHFSKTNAYLLKNGVEPIDWKIE